MFGCRMTYQDILGTYEIHPAFGPNEIDTLFLKLRRTEIY